MTDIELEDKFKELLYHFGETNWNILTSEAWSKYINKQESFTEMQIADLRDFVNDINTNQNREQELVTLLEEAVDIIEDFEWHPSAVEHYSNFCMNSQSVILDCKPKSLLDE